MCACWCACVGVFVWVLLSNRYHSKRCLGEFLFIIVLISIYSNSTVLLFETFMTISTIDTKSGTNGILPHRTMMA